MVGKHPKRRARPGVDRAGRTPLHYAAADAVKEEVVRLLDSGADPSAQDDNGWSPLHFAAQSNSADIAGALLAAGAMVDLKDSDGNTPLFRAVFSSCGDGALIDLLRKAGADPQAANNSGVTPVSLARTIANFDVARFFGDLP
jgi:ankyrin repeat protein